jgi:predicted component of type VI protein secretion system
MVRLKILSGKMAGTEHSARHFPFRLGRAASADLRLEEDGVWDLHAELALDAATGFLVSAQSEALLAVNGRLCREAVLRNGDELDLGALKVRFWIGPTRQKSLRFREWLTWAALALITAGQLVLIYRIAP